MSQPLVPFPPQCITGRFVRRHKRFSVAITVEDSPPESPAEVWIHSNNSGSMLGLTRPGAWVLASPAANPARKLAYTQEAVWLGSQELSDPHGFWVGVNTSLPNRMLAAAFAAGRLAFAEGYSQFKPEKSRGESRLDACCTADSLPPLWIECKNVTMVEDNVACFPDAVTERGQKHLREMMSIVHSGQRAATFYLIQRADGACFGPADFIDPAYASLFWQAVEAGVEIYPYRAIVTAQGVDLGPLLPLARP